VKLYTEKLQQQNNLLKEYWIKTTNIFHLLERVISNHRDEVTIACEESCLCWEIEKYLNLHVAS